MQKVVKLFVDETIDAVYANLVFVDQFDTTQIKRYWKSGLFNKRNFYYGWMPPHPTFFVRREIYEKFGFFNTFLTSAADYELMLRFLLKNNITPRYLPEVIVRMRTGGKSTASLKNRLTANEEDRLAWKINGLKPQFFTLILKPLRKIKQFITYE